MIMSKSRCPQNQMRRQSAMKINRNNIQGKYAMQICLKRLKRQKIWIASASAPFHTGRFAFVVRKCAKNVGF